MKKPIYIRDGSRFRRIEYYTGMFWNLDGSFTETKKDGSIGIVVSQDGNELTIASLDVSTRRMTWSEAIRYCESFSNRLQKVHCYLPTRSELLSAVDNFREHLYTNGHNEWTSTEYSYDYAWYLLWGSSEGVDYGSPKDGTYYVRKFYKVEI